MKTGDRLLIRRAAGIRNPFVNDWKRQFFTDPKKRIASIPFLRNLIEYTKGTERCRLSDAYLTPALEVRLSAHYSE